MGLAGGGFSRPTPRGVSRPTPGGSVSQHALRQTPPADSYCYGRYASYWNAFLFINLFCFVLFASYVLFGIEEVSQRYNTVQVYLILP